MELGISGRYALITGGANGIGKSITEAFANEGVNVIFTSRNQKSIDDMTSRANACGVKAEGILIDFLEKN